jgi:chemotaxis protein MotB
MSNEALAPIIIKRKKVISGGGHHGGAWKVAYADFVTAMMAFFMLMWLLNATTEKQRKGIADYFSPTIAINRVSGGGSDAFGGDSVFTEQTLAQNGTGASKRHPTESNAAKGLQLAGDTETGASSTPSKDDEAMARITNILQGNSGESLVAESELKHINTRVTDEGLIVELFDTPDQALFEGDTDEPTDLMIALTEMLVRVFAIAENGVAIAGHTRSQPLVLANNPVWDQSTKRAHLTRKLLDTAGLEPLRVQRVTGQADRARVDPNPMAVRNNRIEVTLLRTQQQ